MNLNDRIMLRWLQNAQRAFLGALGVENDPEIPEHVSEGRKQALRALRTSRNRKRERMRRRERARQRKLHD
jgi:hypothetical protein